jgi:hypothetical protein
MGFKPIAILEIGITKKSDGVDAIALRIYMTGGLINIKHFFDLVYAQRF